MLFDWLWPPTSRPSDGSSNIDERPILIDAEDLLANPEIILRYICSRTGLEYSESMLSWDSAEDHAQANALFEKFEGYHEDALHSTGIRPQTAEQLESEKRKAAKTREEEDEEWRAKYGGEAAQTIRDAVDLCQPDYEYLRRFKIRIEDLEQEERGATLA